MAPRKVCSVAYTGFSKRGGPGKLRILKTKRRVSLFRFSPVFGVTVGEDQKKRSSLRFSPVFGLKLGKAHKQNKVFSHILSVCVFKLCAKLTKGGAMLHFCIPFYANYTILATQRGGPWHYAPPSEYARGVL